jgi:TetR/AcrR family transcriptional regulator, fatty acid metabolism regulator protein
MKMAAIQNTEQFPGPHARLVAAAKHLIALSGYENVSLASIAEEAHLPEQKLRALFDSKAELLETLMNETWQPLNSRISDILVASLYAREAANSILMALIHVINRDRELARLFLFENRRQRGKTDMHLSRGFQEFMALLISMVERGQRDGSFRANLPARVIASALLGTAEGMVRDSIVSELDGESSLFSESEICSAFQLALRGFAP